MESITKIRLICYDVNGTIIDDTQIFLTVLNEIFKKFGKPEMSLDTLREKFGQPWTKIYREAGISEDIVDDVALYGIYNELYNKQPPALPFPGLKSTLQWLKDKNVSLAIVSTQQNRITVPILKRHGLKDFFIHMKGGVSDKGLALQAIFKKLGMRPEESAYMGDQEGDIFHAKKAGCYSFGFCGGLHSLERLEKAKPDFLILRHSDIKSIAFFD